ncbi:hypothetical protein GCM10008983_09180 [Lentibacillus halophilus]|uniref:Spore coat polysaccharide biosynthesis protein SpsF n=1 Tax=Lentibacillus halophilus TaxID=295065 RepID=A0ABP3IZI4_9BACI
MKITAIVQARMGSTRLSGKVMKELKGNTILSHVIQRLKQAKLIDDIIIATTEHSSDNVIEREAEQNGVRVTRGSEQDVLERYYNAAKGNNTDVIVRITSDCPLIDPFIVDEMIKFYLENDYSLVTNAGAEYQQRTFPRGMDTEVFSFEVLEDAYVNGEKEYQREHVTPYIYEQEGNSIHYFKNDRDFSDYRLTLDTEEDFQLITEIYNKLYTGNHDFYLNDIVNLLKKEPKLYDINAHIEQKKVK